MDTLAANSRPTCLLAGVLVLVTLAFGAASPVEAATFPVAGTVGFETGLVRLATITLIRDDGAIVDWGDGGPAQPSLLVDCRDFLNRTCDVYGTHAYGTLGTFTIRIHYTTPGLPRSPATETTTATISPAGDFVILSIGDSIASGEGDPVITRDRVFEDPRLINRGVWDDPGSNYENAGQDCHRSVFSGPALAARLAMARNPTITFIHFACSGAQVGAVVGQLRTARGRLPRIDVLLISAGANNMTFRRPNGLIGVGFGAVVLRCLRPFDPCSNDPRFEEDIRDSIEGNPGRVLTGKRTEDGDTENFSFPGLASLYGDLDKEINCINPDDESHEPNCIDPENQIPKLVLITEYHDPTHDKNGEFPSGLTLVGCVDPGVIQAEFEFLFEHVVTKLNAKVGTSPWHPVLGIQDGFQTHGLCALDQRWVVTIPDSGVLQGDTAGTGHPNYVGQGLFGTQTYLMIVELNPPVTTASAIAGGNAYEFGTWTAQDVRVTLAAKNFITESGIGNTYYAVDEPACTPDTVESCSIYAGPFTISTSGKHTVTLFSENASGHREAAHSVEVWIDKDPPRMACDGTPPALWPPHGRLVPVRMTVEAVDEVSGAVPFVLTSATASEGDAAEDIQGFIIGQPDTEGWMRATRFGHGPGRNYTLTYMSMDAVGNVGSCRVTIAVPHDQRPPRVSRNDGHD